MEEVSQYFHETGKIQSSVRWKVTAKSDSESPRSRKVENWTLAEQDAGPHCHRYQPGPTSADPAERAHGEADPHKPVQTDAAHEQNGPWNHKG